MQPLIGVMTGPEMKYRAKQALTALIAIAGLRDHGPHLASGSEIELLDAYSRKASERLHPYLFVYPTITTSLGNRSLLRLSESAFKATILDAAKALRSLQIERITVISNSKKDLEVSKETLAQLEGKKKSMGIWELHPKIAELEGEDPLAIGNAFLTAQMLYIQPGMVKPEMLRYADASFGVSGDPKKASAEIGKKIFDQTFESFVSELDMFMRE